VIWCAAVRRRLAAAFTGVALAIPVALADPAVAADPTPTPTASPSLSASAASPSSPAAPIPCPHATAPKVNRPPRPVPPPSNPVDQAVGGDQLATPGLVTVPGAPPAPAITAQSWIVADLDTGEVLGACGAHEYATPASVQKLLLVATMLPKLDLKQVVTVTHQDVAIKPGTSIVGLVEGGKYTVEEVLLGLLLESGNDAANVIARLGGGSVPDGVRMMNEEAAKLGARQTHAVTPSGLDGKGQFTSAYDLALIFRQDFSSDTFRRLTLTKTAVMPAQGAKYKAFQIQNENKLIFSYPGALGGKTGFTDLARHTYVGAAERNGRRLVATLLGGEPRPLRGWQQGQALLDWGFQVPTGASVGHLVTADEVAASPSPSPSPTPVTGLEVLATGDTKSLPPMILLGAFVAAVALLAGFLNMRRRRRRRSFSRI
jgi:serine-type D-Ala-D-Ala carboxypeptidase (penicillin-binding protein 5/6)